MITLSADFLDVRVVDQDSLTQLSSLLVWVSRRRPLWIINVAGRDIDFVQKIFMLKGQLRATPRTKTPRALRGRLKPGRLAANEPKLRPRHAEPRDERSPGDSPADRAMAVRLIKGCGPCLITDPTAKTSTP